MTIRPRSRLSAFARDVRGVSAIEFAFIAPALVGFYFGFAELQHLEICKLKVSHAAAAVGDLVTQDDATTKAGVADVFSAASSIVYPFPSTALSLRVTSITIGADGKAAVDWSESKGGALPAAIPTVPTGLISAVGDTVVIAEAAYTYMPSVALNKTTGYKVQETSFSLPRTGGTVKCGDCSKP